MRPAPIPDSAIDHAGEAGGLVCLGDVWIRPDAVNALTLGGVSSDVTTVYLASGQTLTVHRTSPAQVAGRLGLGVAS